jgi:IclR family acetate operon transcriptional repressor
LALLTRLGGRDIVAAYEIAFQMSIYRPTMFTKKATAPVQSLERGLRVLRAVGRAPGPMTLGELTRAVELDRSCVFRLATTLAQQGFLSQSPRTKEYVLGPAIWELVGYMQQSNPLLVAARKRLAALAGATGETAHLSVRQNDRAISLEHQLTAQRTGVMTSAGRSELLYCSAVGKALLVDFSPQDLRNLLGAGRLSARTARTIRSVGDLYQDCQTAAERGYSVDDEEYAEGVRCVASPVRDFRGEIVAAIGISAPADRLPRRQFAKVGQFISEIAKQLSNELGCVERPTTHGQQTGPGALRFSQQPRPR